MSWQVLGGSRRSKEGLEGLARARRVREKYGGSRSGGQGLGRSKRGQEGLGGT